MTDLMFLDDTELFVCDAKVLSLDSSVDSAQSVMVLDRTIFYPQGGGQPTDLGRIAKDGAEFAVTKVSFSEGTVYHAGAVTAGEFRPGDDVSLNIDGERRMRHAKLHTGGHLVMTAVSRLLQLPAVKGYHFPDGPYVEFSGSVDPGGRDELLVRLQKELDGLVAEDSQVISECIDIEQLRAQGVLVPAEILRGKPTRVVITAGYKSPCGGTHMKRTGQLAGLRIKGIKAKAANTRVSYLLEGMQGA
jgi:Ser-tRNA(Ala) deacylase AlaX